MRWDTQYIYCVSWIPNIYTLCVISWIPATNTVIINNNRSKSCAKKLITGSPFLSGQRYQCSKFNNNIINIYYIIWFACMSVYLCLHVTTHGGPFLTDRDKIWNGDQSGHGAGH